MGRHSRPPPFAAFSHQDADLGSGEDAPGAKQYTELGSSDPGLAGHWVGKAFAAAGLVIAALLALLFAASYLISKLLGLPSSMGLPPPIRAVGVAVILSGLALVCWLFTYRGPSNMIRSTYITLAKLFRMVLLAERSARTEPLVIDGPQRYTRNPLYFGVVVIVLGWALFTSSTFIFIAAIVLYLWYRFYLIPFEESELSALFGDEYRA